MPRAEPTAGARELEAEARVFGHAPVPTHLRVIPRSRRWRGLHAARWFAGGAVFAPLLAVLPPHAPWGVAAGLTGVVLGLRRWKECFTLIGIEGRCPRCEAPLELGRATPLAVPHSLSCGGCGNLVTLHPDLPAAAPD